jgi:3-oxoacyl-[acyl-carrier protein] reductase
MNDYLQKNFGLSGRRAVVTGAGRGIGRAIALALAGAGAEVCVHFNSSKAAADEVAAEIKKSGGKAWTFGADLTKSAEAKKLAGAVKDRWDALDILVNNAGDLVKRSPIADADDATIEKIIQVNINTALYTTRACIPLLKLGVQPSLINLSSVAAHHGGGNGAVIYAMTKGAIHTLTRGLAKELAPGIRVNGIAPGVATTDFHRKYTSDEAMKTMASNTPLKRNSTAEECSAAAVFLSAPGASFITGEIIEINGGLWLA